MFRRLKGNGQFLFLQIKVSFSGRTLFDVSSSEVKYSSSSGVVTYFKQSFPFMLAALRPFMLYVPENLLLKLAATISFSCDNIWLMADLDSPSATMLVQLAWKSCIWRHYSLFLGGRKKPGVTGDKGNPFSFTF